mmetsp:Transcript_123574/g.357365  ORF Transcript_123574/g.357365 Transcript_123574/m.357365 type:complete len:348 (+) Transcript_123574:111-1154(+)|eukprot:CAMPEP_0176048642 /NCGR_PEP_ID=MMETSP0120_2-20121206/24164_1 /TAXON_ID=160619 /ORGANISM="Kryptoperidinium foliaceum, Strain CCMP 1326" /LENGTH=347 /DNA_ID=CAMNT_0017382061 /DNA_START=21 /DNA_END=1064 /DNA_ORIENTATION=-
MAGISEGEVAVYDRQLRLWGVQAQQRLLKAKVVVWGIEGCNVEVCKNLVLAGISLVIRDHRKVELADIAFNYFLREEDLGKSRAECAAKRVQEMNPLCSVTSSDAPPPAAAGDAAAAALKEQLQGCDVVICSLGVLDFDPALASVVDRVCRQVGPSFFLTLSAGELAFFFSNLNTHVVQERSGAQGAGATASTQTGGPETIEFPSLAEFLSLSPAELQRQKADASFMLVALFLAFAGDRGKKAVPNAGADFAAFCAEAKCVPSVDGFADLLHAYACFFVEPLMHVASVASGLLAQEVIKAITKRDVPLVNSICFNAHTGAALVERLPAPAKPAVKRKAEEIATDILD